MPFSILHQGDFLIASMQSSLSDSEVVRLRDELSEHVGRARSKGIVVDVGSLDVIDSFVCRSLRALALTTKLRGAETVVVGITPQVAFAMAQLGLNFDDVRTALDLEEGLEFLQGRTDSMYT
jgi:rsbT antagonist protein RsbS